MGLGAHLFNTGEGLVSLQGPLYGFPDKRYQVSSHETGCYSRSESPKRFTFGFSKAGPRSVQDEWLFGRLTEEVTI